MGARRRPRPRRQRSRVALRSTLILVALLGTLFMACWGANRVERLERKRTALQREIDFQGDEYRRLLSAWLRATDRERIVGRASRELALMEPSPQDRSILVLPSTDEKDTVAHPFLEHLARSLDRYGQVESALAKEGQ